MKHWYGIAACLVAGGLVVFLFERHQAAVLSGMQAQIGALQARAPQAADAPDNHDLLAAMRLAQMSIPPAAPGASEARQDTPPPVGSAPPQRRPALTVSRVRDFYETTWAAEPTDSKWADSATKLARDRVASVLPTGSTVDSIDCKDSMCRIETSHATRAQYQAFVDGALRDPHTHIWNGGYMFALESDDSARGGDIKVVSFLARDGAELPPITP